MPTKKNTRTTSSTSFTLKRRIELLFLSAERRGLSITLQSIAAETGLGYGTVQALKEGESTQTSWITLKKFGSYFGVPLAYFDVEAENDAQKFLEIIEAKENGIPLETNVGTNNAGELVLLRADDVSPEARKAIISMINFILEKEHNGEKWDGTKNGQTNN